MKRLIIVFALFFILQGCIDNTPPEVIIELNSPTRGEAPLYPDFSYGCSDLEDERVLCIIEVDGKVIYEGKVPPYPELEVEPFTTEGKHTIRIIAIDSEGLREENIVEYFVEGRKNSPPVVSIKSDKKEGRVPFYPEFTYECYDPDGDKVECFIISRSKKIKLNENLDWPENETIVFRKPGEYRIEIVGRDEYGRESRDYETFIVDDKIYVYIEELPSGIDDGYKRALYNAFDFWEKQLGVKFIETKELDFGEVVYIDWAKEYAGETVGRAEIGGSRMIVGLGDSSCYDKYRIYKPEYVEKIAEHELGHILGFGHSEDEKDIMYPIIEGLSYVIDVEEEEVIPSGWYWFFPTCSSQEVATYRFIVSSDRRVDVFVVPSEEEYNKALNNERFSYYKRCMEESTTYFDSTCNVGKEAGLLIINNGRDVARVSIKIINEGQ